MYINSRISKRTPLLSGIAAVLMLAALVIGCKTNVNSAPETFTVTFSVDGGNGTLKAKADGIAETETDKSPITVEKGKTVTFTAYPTSGYEVDKWTVNGTDMSNDATTYSHKVTAKTDVKVLFKTSATPTPVEKYKVTLEKTEGGNVMVSPALPNDGMVNKGTNLTFTATALTGYELEKWERNGRAVNGTALSYMLTVNEAANVKVFFKTNGTPIIKHTVTLASLVYGTVTSVPEIPSDKQLPEGTEITLTAKADAGYAVDTWTIAPSKALQAGGKAGSETATVKVNADTTVTVTFKALVSDKIYKVGDVAFTMKKIDAVTNKEIGDDSYSTNKVHSISLSAYRIGETEVTQELWEAVMGNNPSYFSSNPEGSEEQGKRPVERVNWYHVIAFCNKLSKKCNLEPCYTVQGVDFESLEFKEIPTRDNGKAHSKWDQAKVDMSKNGFRLPTEAEWEWAAMGGTSNRWAGTSTEGELKDYAWYGDTDHGKTHEVKKKKANGYGLYDMSGNVFEWCWDWYESLPDPMGKDYAGPAFGSNRVVRGGGWPHGAHVAARAYRGGSSPDNRSGDFGLRLACRP